MKKEEIEKLKKSIAEAEDALKKGLIQDEAASQLRSMIYYYKEKIKKEEAMNEKI